MKLGKLTTDELNKNVISLLHKNRSEVLLSSAIGEDCAALDLKDVIVVSSDPITAVVEKEKLGALCVSVCCNDVAANGGEPVAMTITLIMPPSSSAEDVAQLNARMSLMWTSWAVIRNFPTAWCAPLRAVRRSEKREN